jgi:glycosyltransferase involved in cell wall biosynthesis
MRIAYVTPFDARNLNGRKNWSGLGYYIAQSLKDQSIHLDYIGPLEDRLALEFAYKIKSVYYKLWGRTHIRDSDPLILRDYARQISEKLSSINVDIVFSTSSNSIAYLKCNQPIVFWGDATFSGLENFYPQYTNLSQESFENWHVLERFALEKCKLAIYASEWAAQTAIEHYSAHPDKVKVVPFGANIDSGQTVSEIKDLIESRPSNHCKLLFLGVDWYRKGGDVALKAAESLNNLGLPTTLTVVGCQPISEGTLPSFVKPLGFISKSSSAGKRRINQLIAESHFLILPSRAECYGVVFCEANSLGVPCISRKVGGIPTIIKDDLNGKLFDDNKDYMEYCEYIFNIFTNYSQYKKLALSAFNEYESRLNWRVAGQKVRDLLMTII